MATMGEKDERPSIQRRTGRRISIPSSPISFTLSKRNDRQVRSPEVLSAADAFSSIDTPSDRPSIDLNFPSPLLDTSFFSPVSATDAGRNVNHPHNTPSEDTERSKLPGTWDNPQGPPLAGRNLEVRHAQSPRPNYLTEMPSRSSPIISGYRDRSDHGRCSEGKDRNLDATAPLAGRNYSTTSLSTDRSASDENVTFKAPTSKKSRLNLLNPMSLLARRRSSQNAKVEDMKVNVSPLQVPAIPENFDPCIRGNFVHDFSTPRNRRAPLDNSPRRETFSSPATFTRPSDFGTPVLQHGNTQSPASHSPMFREHFQEGNAIQPDQTAYLHSAATSRQNFDAPSPASLPSFAQKLPAILPEPEKLSAGTHESPQLPQIKQVPHPESSPPPPPPLSPKRTPSPHLDLPPVAALPKHMTSVSSRFSFQIAGQDSSAQEKLLEEKHKEHFGSPPDVQSKSADDEDEYENYDFDPEDNDYEEDVPGMNVVSDDDGFGNEDIPIKNIEISSSQQESSVPNDVLRNFHFTPPDMAFSPSSTHHTSEPTPRDDQGFPIGMADTKNSPAEYRPDHTIDHTPSLFLEGLRISTINDQPDTRQEINQIMLDTAFDDSELYFDDGEFDMDHNGTDDQFDENLLDAESGPIRDIPAENAKKYEEAMLQKTGPSDRIIALDSNEPRLSRDTSSSSNFFHMGRGDDDSFSASQDHEFDHTRSSKTSVLTEDNLAAYHDALVEAANFAAANGKFDRQVSFNSSCSDDAEPSHPYNSRPSLTLNDLRFSEDTPDSESMEGQHIAGFDVDDLDDDLMIAEANAEALENDDEGFYGQEFGFYARSHSKDTSELVNGGYFTARGSNGVKRSHSGKAVFQEPSLTPITERSEWSTRNSVVSFNAHGGYSGAAGALTSPGIDQLLDSPSFEDEMTLSALMKLRRGAFGGSSTSVNSLGERSVPGSSPLAHGSKHMFPSSENLLSANNAKYTMGNSTSIIESEDEDAADMEQLTLTQNTPQKRKTGESPPPPSTPYGQQQSSVHLTVTESPRTSRKVQHHRRSSSGADSVSYVRDTDGQWVLEKRRTGDDGEQEVVEREYLAGARI